MSKAANKSKFKLVVSALLLLFCMQLASIVHANEHALNSTEQACITHLELSKFSNLIPSDSLVLPLPSQIFVQYTFTTNTIYSTFSKHYCSRAPPIFK